MKRVRYISLILPLLVGVGLIIGIGKPASAEYPPLIQQDFDFIFSQEHFRDDGRVLQVGCETGAFTDPEFNGQFIWEFFADKLPAHQIAGIIGNMQWESGLLPTRLLNLRDSDILLIGAHQLSTAQRNNPLDLARLMADPLDQATGTSWGIVQFHPPGKFIDTQENVTDANLLINQLVFVWDQLEGRGPSSELAAGNALKSTTTVEEATRVFAERYERPGQAEVDRSFEQRLAAANGALVRFGNIPTVDSPVNPPIDGAIPEFPVQAPSTPSTSSCSEAGDGGGQVSGVAQEQLLNGGANFIRDLRELGEDMPNSADFVSWALLQAGTPLPGGVGGWRYSSTDAIEDLYRNNADGLQFIPAEQGLPQINDIAFFDSPGNNYVGVVVSVNPTENEFNIIFLDTDGNIKEETRSAVPGADGLIGYGRMASQHSPPGGPGGDNGSVAGLNNPAGLNLTQGCMGQNPSQITAVGMNVVARNEINGISNCFMENAERPDNGAHPHGNFRLVCTPSHFSYDDPIIFPGQAGRAHLHMFWGNTNANANTTTNSLLNSGNSSCQGGPLNRSAYWAPAMIAGHGENARIAMPKVITLYYKAQRPDETSALPKGIQLLVGNVNPGGSVNNSFTPEEGLSWGCYDPARGLAVNRVSTIPGTNGTPQCPNGFDIQASIQFPQCVQGTPSNPVLTHADYISHTRRVHEQTRCPGGFFRVPQISYLIRWSNPAGLQESNWRLSSDAGFDQPTVSSPGGSLHGDWLGGWQDDTINLWQQNCIRNRRNCSIGQTGTSRQFRRIFGSNLDGGLMEYNGPQYLDITGGTGGGGDSGGGDGDAPTLPGGCRTSGGYVNPNPGTCVGAPNRNLPTFEGNTNPRRDIDNLSSGQVIDGQTIFGCLNVNVPNVTIRNSRIICYQGRDIAYHAGRCGDFSGCPGHYDGAVDSRSTNLTLENNDILCGTNINGGLESNVAPCDYLVNGRNFTARRNNMYNTTDAFFPTANAVIEDNYIHGMLEVREEWIEFQYTRNGTNRYSHSDAVQVEFWNGGNLTVRGNYFQGRSDSGGASGLQAILIKLGNSVIANNRFDDHFKSLRIAPIGGSGSVTNNIVDNIYRSNTSVIWTRGSRTISGNVFENGSPVTESNIRRN